MLKAIGLWIQTLADEERPAPQELVGQLPSQVRTALASYLSGGLRLVQCRGYSWCRFECGAKDSEMGSWDLTDGTWVWPEGLAHYVAVHGVILPEEFVERALSGTAPTRPCVESPQNYDFDYWRYWCSARRSLAVKESLRNALVAAQTRVAAIKLERADALEQKYGLSGDQCNWTHCTRTALMGRLVCATHFLNAMDVAAAETPLYNGLQEFLRQLQKGARDVRASVQQRS